jgi:hypothetical protein
MWGHSSAGRALAWHARGRRFDPAWLHQISIRDIEQLIRPASPSSRGLGHHPFTVRTGVRIPVGTPPPAGHPAHTALVVDSGEKLPVTAPDQILVSGVLTGGAPVSLHYRAGMPRDGAGPLWEINGTEGELRVTGPFGHLQFVPLTLSGARGNEKAFQTLTVPADYRAELPADPMVGNVALTYARMAADLRQGTRTAPSFDDAPTMPTLRSCDVIGSSLRCRSLPSGARRRARLAGVQGSYLMGPCIADRRVMRWNDGIWPTAAVRIVSTSTVIGRSSSRIAPYPMY